MKLQSRRATWICSLLCRWGSWGYREVKQLAQGDKASLEYDLQTFLNIASGLRCLISENYNFGEAQNTPPEIRLGGTFKNVSLKHGGRCMPGGGKSLTLRRWHWGSVSAYLLKALVRHPEKRRFCHGVRTAFCIIRHSKNTETTCHVHCEKSSRASEFLRSPWSALLRASHALYILSFTPKPVEQKTRTSFPLGTTLPTSKTFKHVLNANVFTCILWLFTELGLISAHKTQSPLKLADFLHSAAEKATRTKRDSSTGFYRMNF